ncbi:hypothetical protein ACF3NF_05930 [Anaerococcus martiniensis]|uniref:hypothetical protein n=1 Tax=Anaerococcus sp. WGS1579 TaxID=3366809 RepID=UPI00372D38A7
MKNKKLYAGTIALALSIGAIAPLGNNAISSVAYATEATDASANKKTIEELKANLKSLVDNYDNVEESSRYENSTKVEKEKYKKSIVDAKKVLESNDAYTASQLTGYINDIKEAINNLAASAKLTVDDREALSSTIAIANKLAGSTKLTQADTDNLITYINTAKETLADYSKNNDEIKNENSILAKKINDLMDSYSLEAKDFDLKDTDLNNINSNDYRAIAKAHNNLFSFQEKAKKFFDKSVANNDKLTYEEKNKLSIAITEAANEINNVNASADSLNTAYSNLAAEYDKLVAKIGSEKTIKEDLKDKLELLIGSDRDELINKNNYRMSNPAAKSTYDKAVENGRDILNKENPSETDLQKALQNINLAKLALAPVETKTIDQNPSQKTPKENLNDLINGADDYRAKDPYKSASDAGKKAYDDAITTAKNIYNNSKSTDAQYNAAIQTIKEAQNKLANPTNEDQKIYELAKNILHGFVNNKDQVTKNSVYTNADADKKTAYDNAIANANKLLVKIANGESVSLDQLHENIIKVGNALTDLGYKEELKYPNTLKELIDEAPSFRQSYAYYLKNNSEKDADKALIKTYEDLIKLVSDNLETLSKDADLSQKYVDRINEIKREIAGQSSNSAQEENKKILKELIDLATKVQAHPDYVTVSDTQSKNLNEAIIAARRALSNDNASDIAAARTYLTNQLNQSEIKPIVEKIKNKNESEDLKEKSPRQNIEDFIKGDKSLRDSVNYKKAQKTLRDAYDKAIEEGKEILKKEDASEEELTAVANKIMEAINDLDGNKFAARVDQLKENYKNKGGQITDANKKAAVEAKLKALEDENATMDELIAAETELTNALKLNGTSTPIATTTTTTTPVSGTTTTTTPVTTTRQVPATVNPGSIVRTGIKSLVGVAALLVVALGAFALTSKNKDKNEKTKRRENNEIK